MKNIFRRATKLLFKNILKQTFNESVSYTYKPTKNFLENIGDFYYLSYFNSVFLNEDLKKNFELKPGFDESTLMDLEIIVRDGFRDIVNFLYDEVVKVLIFSITSEIRHAFLINNFLVKKYIDEHNLPLRVNKDNNNSKSTNEFLKKNKQLQNIFYKLSLPIFDNFLKQSSSKILKPIGFKIDYDKSYKAFKDSGLSNSQLVNLAKKMFDEPELWPSDSYGGENWVNVAECLEKLESARTIEEKSIWIDHALDLQHNNGSVFDKIEKYQTIINDIMISLEMKKISSLNRLHDMTSIPKNIHELLRRYVGDIISNYEQIDSENDFMDYSPSWLVSYAKNVLKGKRLPKSAEEFILEYPLQSYDYVKLIIREPWPKAEKTISRSAHASYLYAKNILNKRFHAGEKTIKTNKTYWEDYKKHFGID